MKTSFIDVLTGDCIADVAWPSGQLLKKLREATNIAGRESGCDMVFRPDVDLILEAGDLKATVEKVHLAVREMTPNRAEGRFKLEDPKLGIIGRNLRSASGFVFHGRPAMIDCSTYGVCLLVWLDQEQSSPLALRSERLHGVQVLVDDNGKKISMTKASVLLDLTGQLEGLLERLCGLSSVSPVRVISGA